MQCVRLRTAALRRRHTVNRYLIDYRFYSCTTHKALLHAWSWAWPVEAVGTSQLPPTPRVPLLHVRRSALRSWPSRKLCIGRSQEACLRPMIATSAWFWWSRSSIATGIFSKTFSKTCSARLTAWSATQSNACMRDKQGFTGLDFQAILSQILRDLLYQVRHIRHSAP